MFCFRTLTIVALEITAVLHFVLTITQKNILEIGKLAKYAQVTLRLRCTFTMAPMNTTLKN